MELIKITTNCFLLANPIGNSPAIVSLLKDIPFERQKRIMLYESLFSFLIAVFFLYAGDLFLTAVNVKDYTLQLCSGILLFFVAFEMIFPSHPDVVVGEGKLEPFIVPISTPLIAGPSLMTIVMLMGQQYYHLQVLAGLSLAWIAVTAILCSAPYLQRVLGKRGLAALEQLMGMLLAMIAVDTAVKGLSRYLSYLSV